MLSIQFFPHSVKLWCLKSWGTGGDIGNATQQIYKASNLFWKKSSDQSHSVCLLELFIFFFPFLIENVLWISQLLFIHIHDRDMDGWVVFINNSSECWSTHHSTLRNPLCLDEADDVNLVDEEYQITFWYFIQVISLICHQAGMQPTHCKCYLGAWWNVKTEHHRDDWINVINPTYIFAPANVWPELFSFFLKLST